MPATTTFTGFPKRTLRFYRDLAANNDRLWFNEHKADYQRYVIEPALEFVEVMGARLRRIAPAVVADPRLNGSGSIFRIHRDIRFSKDKSPFKTHLGIDFWIGEKKMGSPGFYFHLEPRRLFLGAGLHLFSKEHLERYRQAVDDKKTGPALVRAMGQVTKKGDYEFGGKHYKRVPRGFDPEHRRAELLLHKGFYAYQDGKLPAALHGPEIIDHCHDRFKDMAPVVKWLVTMVN